MIFITSTHHMAIKDKNNDSDIIKGNNYDNDNGYDRKNEKINEINWTYRVVSHSKLKIDSNDIFHEYGHWIMHNLLSKCNQESINMTIYLVVDFHGLYGLHGLHWILMDIL